MRAVIIDAPGNVRVGSIPDPTPKPDELVVRVGACGICGTDLHIVDGDSPLVCYPLVPGHEFAGEVVAVGRNVSRGNGTGDMNITVGTRIAVDPTLNCGHCEFCRTGRENLCLNYAAIGVTVDGACAEYVTVPVNRAYILPEHLSFREAALIEPISCAVHGIHLLNLRPGDTCLVVGAGTMGLILAQLALRGGASKVVMVDLNMQRLQRAKKLGVNSIQTDINKLLEDEPLGFDCAIDVTGVASAIEGAFTAVKRGGKLLIFGVASSEARISLSPFRIYNDEITVLGSMAVLHSFGPALNLLSSGAIDTEVMLTTALPLEDFPDALSLVRRGEGVKTQILPNG
ncbi:MAG TPA: zinc-dependent alcohol dehydrogenase family protein [Ktedonobacteraceae bacterium]